MDTKFERRFSGLASRLAREGGIVLIGAGLSTAAGIPDFRSRDGLLTRCPVIAALLSAQGRARHPERVGAALAEAEHFIRGAAPTAAHRALDHLQRLGVVHGVISQNVDGLDQQVLRDVVALHGTLADPSSLVLFGDAVDGGRLALAEDLARRSAVLLCVGTSLTVAPANRLPDIVLGSGGRIAIFNHDATLYDERAYLVDRRPLDVSLPALAYQVGRWVQDVRQIRS